MVNKSLLITISTMLIYHLAFSQKEANVWYFGANAGVSFHSDQPTAINNSKMQSSEGCAIQNSYNGRLLFYTDGVTVWDSTHTVMPNGKGLKGNSSSTQSAVIVQKPFTFNSFYIFTVDNVGGTDGLTYSEINMTYNKGKGDILPWAKNKKLVTPVCEKITTVKHANGIDHWVLVHKFNSDLIFAYLVTGYGVYYWPVVSKTGFKISGNYSNTLGYMKFSPDGRKVAYANYALDSTAIGNFDAKTGLVKNVFTFPNDNAYGVEFSPKSKYLYIGEFSTKKIFQYDAKAVTKHDFLASKKIIDSGYSSDLGALQLGPDGKIYVSVTGSKYLQVINTPDSSGSGSNPQKDYIYLNGRTCILGLPNFSASIFNKKVILVKRNCVNDSTTFTISNTNDLDSVWWNFGDVNSGSNNYSKKINGAYHTYSKTGYYTVNLFYFYKKTFGWSSFRFFVRNPKPYIGKDTTFCNSFSLTLDPQKNYPEYKWNNNYSSKIITVSQKGTYILTIKDSAGCYSSDSILIKNPSIKADFSISDTLQCLKNNVFAFSNISKFEDDSGKQYVWDFGDGSRLSDSIQKKEYINPGVYKVKLDIQSISGCKGSIEKTVRVIANPVAQFSATSPCFPESVQFTNQSSISSGKIISHIWDFGDNTSSIPIAIETNPVKQYAEASKYTVSLTVISDNGCVDSIIKRKGVWLKSKPTALFTISEVQSLNNGKKTIQFNNLSTGNIKVNHWDFGKGKTSYDKNPALNYMDSGANKFLLKVTSDGGCTDTFSIITYHKFYFYLPTAFSPDDNNINETFAPVSSLFVKSYKMEIFNSWGEKVFESTDPAYGWDGNFMNNKCPDGVYICRIALTPYNGFLQHFQSSIKLMR